MHARRVLVALLVLTSGCYFYSHPPPRPRLELPTVDAGAQIELESERKSSWTRCHDEGSGCRFVRGIWRRTSYWTEVTATYGGKLLTQAELRSLVDPTYGPNWDRIDKKRGTCKASLAPTAIAFLGLAVSGGALFYGKGILGDANRETSTTKAVMYAGAGAFVGVGLLSYPIGGHACMSAVNIAHSTRYKYGRDTEWVVSEGRPRSKHEMAEIVKLVEVFNAKARRGASAMAGAPAMIDPPPTDEANTSSKPTLRTFLLGHNIEDVLTPPS